MVGRSILIVDDEAPIREMIAVALEMAGYDCLEADNAQDAHAIIVDRKPDLILLDWMLPGGTSGIELARRLKREELTSDIPIIMLTAKGEDVDRIVGLEVGADDYLGKPFNPRELLARIHAVLRRRPSVEAPGAPSIDPELVTFGPYTFDLGVRSLRRGDEELPLTTGEFAMLKALVRHPRQPLSREKLAQLARGRDFEPFDRSLDVQVSRLRKLVEADATAPRYIQTVWGVGYVFVPDGAA